jgi:hypothetical protein
MSGNGLAPLGRVILTGQDRSEPAEALRFKKSPALVGLNDGPE